MVVLEEVILNNLHKFSQYNSFYSGDCLQTSKYHMLVTLGKTAVHIHCLGFPGVRAFQVDVIVLLGKWS